MWIGIDDTDSVNGGCTTYIALVCIKRLTQEGFAIIGFPRLIRLNPNIPWKTRGNGSISFQIARSGKEKIVIGKFKGNDLFASKIFKEDPNDEQTSHVKSIIQEVIEEYGQTDDENTNPGFVLTKKQPDYELYEKATREIIQLAEIKKLLKEKKAEYISYKNERGLIGATAGIGWIPNDDYTYELITYREEKRFGTKRDVEEGSVKAIDQQYQSTFDNYDYINNHNRIVPSSPCPVLYGIRGDNAEDLLKASSSIKSERKNGWMIYLTNQGTDQHLEKTIIQNVTQYQSVIIEGTVTKQPYTIQGGHVIFSIKDQTGEIDCAAYEPTKEFRNTIRQLHKSDLIEVYGGVREKPLTVNLEKISIKKLEKIKEKIENPICPKCGKHMKSKGTNQGFKCKICGLKDSNPKIEEKKRLIKTGFYEVPVCARRHLSKPLKRY